MKAVDPDGDKVYYGLSGLPQGTTYTPVVADNSAVFSWTPQPAHGGNTYTGTFSCSDGKGGSDSETIEITVSTYATLTPTPTPLPEPTPQPDPTPTTRPAPVVPVTLTFDSSPSPRPTGLPSPEPSTTPLTAYLYVLNGRGHIPHQVTFALKIENYVGAYQTEWDFNNDGIIDAQGASTLVHTYNEAGDYRPCVMVTDENLNSTQVCSVAPVIIREPMEVIVEADPGIVKQGSPVSYHLTVRNAIGRIMAVWDYDNDGSVEAKGTRDTIYTYQNPGDYIASVVVIDQAKAYAIGMLETPVHVYDETLICGDDTCSAHEDFLNCPDDCPSTFCSNGNDDDLDGFIDLDDPDCEDAKDTSEFSDDYFDAVLNPGDRYHLFDEWYISVSLDGRYYTIDNNNRPTYTPADVSEMIQQHIDEGRSQIGNCQGVEGFTSDALDNF